MWGGRTGAVLACFFGVCAAACGGSTSETEGMGGLDAGEADGSGASRSEGSGGAAGPTTGGSSTGGETSVPITEPECPDEPAPPPAQECDPFDPLAGCGDGLGCYPFLEYPFGEGCGHPVFGAFCAPADTGEQGEFCGGELGYCAPGFMCVVGAAGGKRCAQLCSVTSAGDCPAGLICGETDVKGYGVCF